jgi:hypothetical protein
MIGGTMIGMISFYYVQEGSPRNVSLLLWAGAEPNVAVARPDCDQIEDSALEAAAGGGNLEMLKALKPEKYPDHLGAVLRASWLGKSIPVIDYLVGLGASLNDGTKGGSELLDTLIRVGLDNWPSDGGRAEESLRVIEHICRLGAKWVIVEEKPAKHARGILRRIPPDRLHRLISILIENKSAAPEFIEEIILTPGMQRRLGPYARSVHNSLHPPPPRKPQKEPEENAPAVALPIAEVRKRAEQFILQKVVGQGRLHFTCTSFYDELVFRQIQKPLGLGEDHEDLGHKVMAEACERLNQRLSNLKFEYKEERNMWRRTLSVSLTPKGEWEDAYGEVVRHLDEQPRFWLSRQASALLRLIEAGKCGETISEGQFPIKLGIGRFDRMDRFITELARESRGEFRFALEGDGEEPKTWRISRGEVLANPVVEAVNPEWPVAYGHPARKDFESFRAGVYGLLRKVRPDGSGPLVLFRIDKRSDFLRCFPGIRVPERFEASHGLAEFFGKLTFNAIERAYDVRDEEPVWHFTLRPVKTWEETLAAIETEEKQPSLESRYGLTAEAARLLGWIRELPPDRLEKGWTPSVEDCDDKEIGLELPGGDEAFPFHLQVLIDEISERTAYRITSFASREYSGRKTRLKLTEKPSDLDAIVRQIQWLALQRNKLLNAERAKAAVETLIAG